MFTNKTLMISGGTGSFGNAVLNRFLNSDLAEIRVFSRDEKKQEDMRRAFNHEKLRFYIGDVRDIDSVRAAINGVDYVFHAAALKQVPSCEFHPMEAVRTNVLGAENMMNAALEAGVERMIVLSTDKAVYPVNAMGLSKAMMEKLMVAKARARRPGETVFCATRYGNVMASRGSVIPLFMDQIRRGRDLTVTDPAMTRFLMSLADSVNLVVHAFQYGTQGDIFVQKAPASTVGDLARALIELFEADCTVKVIGTRHGEKLYESLLSREEIARATDTGAHYRVPADVRDLNYDKFFSEGATEVSGQEDYTSHNTQRLNVSQVKDLLMTLEEVREAVAAYKSRSDA